MLASCNGYSLRVWRAGAPSRQSGLCELVHARRSLWQNGGHRMSYYWQQGRVTLRRRDTVQVIDQYGNGLPMSEHSSAY